MNELTKISAERVHQLFQLLKKLDMAKIVYTHYNVEDIYNAWRYAKKYELQKKQSTDTETD